MSNGVDNTQLVNKAAKKPNINSDSFLVTPSNPVILDSQSYINNKVIQVNQFNSGLTVQISLDGVNFYAGPTISTIGIYSVVVPCRYIKFTSTGNCSGLVLGSL